jgi:hypothetical protein
VRRFRGAYPHRQHSIASDSLNLHQATSAFVAQQMSGHEGSCNRLRMVHSDIIAKGQVATGVGSADLVEVSTEPA